MTFLKSFTSCIFLLLPVIGFSQEETPATPVEATQPDQPAQFNGGTQEMRRYIAMNIGYPDIPDEDRGSIQGKTLLSFTVSETGRISGIKVEKGLPGCAPCDAEAVKIVEGMPDWIPATLNGKPVSSRVELPIAFML
jgi:protein TonB